MRPFLLILLATSFGCKTAEFAVDHSMTGVHVAAKFEAKDDNKATGGGPELVAAQ